MQILINHKRCTFPCKGGSYAHYTALYDTAGNISCMPLVDYTKLKDP